MVEKEQKDKLNKALIKKALGYSVEEVVEEYNMQADKMVLLKRKLNTKTFPPDLSAIQILLENTEKQNEYENMTLQQLQQEKIKLIQMLEKEETNEHTKN